jgi:DNA-binding IclR family transcriptional regulator
MMDETVQSEPAVVKRVTSPSIERALQVIDFLTAHPGRGFTLAELSRRLRISKSTAHVVLNTLTDRGVLQRNADSYEYRLGPALVPIGAVAERSFPALTHAKPEAERLAHDYDGECIVVMATGDELLVVGRSGVPGPLSITYLEGQRHPLAPPLGTIILAWTNEHAVEAWLDRLKDELTLEERDHYRTALDGIRRRGYSVGIRVQRLYELQGLYTNGNLYTPEGRRDISQALSALAHDEFLPAGDDMPPDAEIGFIAAPVFGPDGTMLFAITLMPGEQYRGRDLPALARAVVRAAGRVTAAIDGRPPGGGVAPASSTAARRRR